ncbi:MAG: ribonuclease H-like domain-containing protein, partial [Lachnospiraceae bacterium]
MRIISKSIDFSAQDELLQDIAPLNDFLLLDIETTGLSAEHNAVYLIGCIYHQTDGWNLIQWMDNTGNEEKEVLSSFLLFTSGYRILVHYNGDRFDIPFLRKRIELHSLTDTTFDAKTLDLYKVILPYRRVLGLPDYRQQTMEALLGTGRIEDKSGADLVKV